MKKSLSSYFSNLDEDDIEEYKGKSKLPESIKKEYLENKKIEEWLEDNKCKLFSCSSNGEEKYFKMKKNCKDKDSSSETLVLFGELDIPELNIQRKVVLKISYIYNDKIIGSKLHELSDKERDKKFKEIIFKNMDNSLEVEREIYKYIVPELLQKNTPHLVEYIGSFHCDESESKNVIDNLKNRSSNKRKVDFCVDWLENNDSKVFPRKLNIVILNQTEGKTFEDRLKGEFKDEPKKQKKRLYKVIFQILYTLVCFDRIYFRHNDLHFDNIFVDEHPTKTTKYVIDDDTNITITHKLSSKIFDFDYSTVIHPKVERNYRLDLEETQGCKGTNRCNKIDKRFQIVSFLVLLYTFIKGEDKFKDIKNWILDRMGIDKEKMKKFIKGRDDDGLDHCALNSELKNIPEDLNEKCLYSFIKNFGDKFSTVENASSIYILPDKKSLTILPTKQVKMNRQLFGLPKTRHRNIDLYKTYVDYFKNNGEEVIEYMKILTDRNLSKIWKDEFNNKDYDYFDIISNGYNLFLNVLDKKQFIQVDKLILYLQLCIVMSLPFYSTIDFDKQNENSPIYMFTLYMFKSLKNEDSTDFIQDLEEDNPLKLLSEKSITIYKLDTNSFMTYMNDILISFHIGDIKLSKSITLPVKSFVV